LFPKAYAYEKFRDACKEKKVIPIEKTLKTCGAFNLNTQDALLDFIAEDGFDVLQYYDTQPWAKNPYPDKKILVDSYHFLTGLRPRTIGYMAFMENVVLGKWYLKSFHINYDSLVEYQNGTIVCL
jgi:hypothetical protein